MVNKILHLRMFIFNSIIFFSTLAFSLVYELEYQVEARNDIGDSTSYIYNIKLAPQKISARKFSQNIDVEELYDLKEEIQILINHKNKTYEIYSIFANVEYYDKNMYDFLKRLYDTPYKHLYKQNPLFHEYSKECIFGISTGDEVKKKISKIIKDNKIIFSLDKEKISSITLSNHPFLKSLKIFLEFLKKNLL